jgi:hypothetical protein
MFSCPDKPQTKIPLTRLGAGERALQIRNFDGDETLRIELPLRLCLANNRLHNMPHAGTDPPK